MSTRKQAEKTFTAAALKVLGDHGMATDVASSNRLFVISMAAGVAAVLQQLGVIRVAKKGRGWGGSRSGAGRKGRKHASR